MKLNINNLDLEPNESKRMDCPECGGKNTFTITNESGKLMWNCYKLSCKVSGSKKTNMSALDIKNLINNNTKQTYSQSYQLPEYVVPASNHSDKVKGFTDRWNIPESILYYDIKEDRAVFPIQSNSKVVDAAGRALTGRLPKWRRYGNSNLPFVYKSTQSIPCAVVVEDCISAVVVGQLGFVGVALLGTNVTNEQQKYIERFDSVIVALDPDAMPKTISLSRELGLFVSRVIPFKLTDDLKYRNEEDINRLRSVKWN